MGNRGGRATGAGAALWLSVLTCVWILRFQWLFFQQTLESPELPRSDLWLMLADELLGVEAIAGGEASADAGVRFLWQRVPMLGGAGALLLLALAYGGLVNEICLVRLPLSRVERLVIVAGCGLVLLSTATLFAGLLGQLTRLSLFGPAVLCGLVFLALRLRRWRDPVSPACVVHAKPGGDDERAWRWLALLFWVIGIPFVVYLVLGAFSPPTDFDVREYHLQGPKEWFLDGRISYLRHNVYTSFPFLSEMLCLAGMIVAGDWWSGALTGQVLLACFQLLTAMAVYSTGRRWFGGAVAWLSVLTYLTTPWTLRISLISYAEGALTFYLMSALMLTLIVVRQPVGRIRFLATMVVGLLAGGAMASKYTGLIQVIIPVVLTAVWKIGTQWFGAAASEGAGWRRAVLQEACCFAAGVLLAMGPWMVRNWVDTGNPVFPMAYGIFGGDEWNEALNVRWKRAHGAPEHQLSRVPQHFLDAAVRNKWTSSLLFGLGMPAVLLWRRRAEIRVILLTASWGFLTWWGLTHRIDRFWIPMIPLLSLAAGSVWLISTGRVYRWFLVTTIVAVTVFNLRFCTLSLVGFHVGLMDLDAARQLTIRSDIQTLNQQLSVNDCVLMVGEAEVFDATFPVVYNTVFDDSIFEEIVAAEPAGAGGEDERPADLIRADLRARGVTHVLVNWGEILRYRLPGSYGYAEFVQPVRFDRLVERGVLTEAECLLRSDWGQMSERERSLVRGWDGWEGLVRGAEFRSVLLYRVK